MNRKLLSAKTTEKYYSGICKEDCCKYGRSRKRVPASKWKPSDGVWVCPECGYGIAPFIYSEEGLKTP